ncbi:MAG: phosphodiester glycosidase family protein [Niastella sp.]|nr:phosphodiester glycosidase family protein [Niastella sp.]
MRYKHFPARVLIVVFLILSTGSSLAQNNKDSNKVISYIVDLQKQDLQLYWKDDQGSILGSIERLRQYLNGKQQTLVFAMNGGMYMEDRTPLGLYIQQGRLITKLNTSSGYGNFYMKPNGVFYITTDKKAVVCRTQDYKYSKKISFATQSGPMLVSNGAIHADFKKGSANVNIRNGVGVLPGNKLLFAMTKEPMNFYDFADFFRQQGCLDALYLDGFVSRTYLPEKQWIQTDGSFGVIIGEVRPKTSGAAR